MAGCRLKKVCCVTGLCVGILTGQCGGLFAKMLVTRLSSVAVRPEGVGTGRRDRRHTGCDDLVGVGDCTGHTRRNLIGLGIASG